MVARPAARSAPPRPRPRRVRPVAQAQFLSAALALVSRAGQPLPTRRESVCSGLGWSDCFGPTPSFLKKLVPHALALENRSNLSTPRIPGSPWASFHVGRTEADFERTLLPACRSHMGLVGGCQPLVLFRSPTFAPAETVRHFLVRCLRQVGSCSCWPGPGASSEHQSVNGECRCENRNRHLLSAQTFAKKATCPPGLPPTHLWPGLARRRRHPLRFMRVVVATRASWDLLSSVD